MFWRRNCGISRRRLKEKPSSSIREGSKPWSKKSMNNNVSPAPKSDRQARIALLRAAAEGKLNGLPCPRCAQLCVSVWFTHPAEELYRTWFVCAACGFEMRAQNSGRPPYYSEERDRTIRKSAHEPGLTAR